MFVLIEQFVRLRSEDRSKGILFVCLRQVTAPINFENDPQSTSGNEEIGLFEKAKCLESKSVIVDYGSRSAVPFTRTIKLL